jgi:hypothetical protein
MPTVAGIVNIICGCFALFGFLMLTIFSLFFASIPDIQAEMDGFPLIVVQLAFAIGAVCLLMSALVALFGGVSALQRRRWGWILAGSISAILICAPLGLAAIILVVLSENELRPAT